jgi:hypothetical protein
VHLARGHRVDFIFFWGHTPKTKGVVDRACFSQWFLRPFTVEGVTYPSAEHWMMAAKARLFADDAALERILAARTPAQAKALGRTVRRYDEVAWAAHRFEAVVAGNLAKFGKHDDLRAQLLATRHAVLVEASPRDRVWGIGLAASAPEAHRPSAWRGENLLGFALMQARAQLASRPP